MIIIMMMVVMIRTVMMMMMMMMMMMVMMMMMMMMTMMMMVRLTPIAAAPIMPAIEAYSAPTHLQVLIQIFSKILQIFFRGSAQM